MVGVSLGGPERLFAMDKKDNALLIFW